eukprot:1162087-Pelagomonas_calceolata.AAC.14
MAWTFDAMWPCPVSSWMTTRWGSSTTRLRCTGHHPASALEDVRGLVGFKSLCDVCSDGPVFFFQRQQHSRASSRAPFKCACSISRLPVLASTG